MLRKRICEARFEWSLKCEGPFLIKDGRYEKEKAPEGSQEEKFPAPDEVFISREPKTSLISLAKKSRGDGSILQKLSYYVPGTSLRGVFRSQAELILRSLLPGVKVPATACDPFEQGEKENLFACSHRMAATEPKPSPYADACPACKLFGCTATASRISFEDADIQGGVSCIRDFVGIDRFSGGVSQGAKMRFHVLEKSAFTTTVTVRNFELWQLGLLAYVFRDFEDGRVSLGSGSRAKGFGKVKGTVTGLTLEYVKGKEPGRLLAGIGGLLGEDERGHYGLREEEVEELPLTASATGSDGGSSESSLLLPSLYQQFSVNDLPNFWRVVAGSLGKIHPTEKVA